MLSNSRRADSIQSPMIPVVGSWIRAHPGTISLAQGIVHYDPPAEIGAAVQAAMTGSAVHRYGPVRGEEELLQFLASKLREDNHISLSGRSVLVTAGSNMAFLHAISAIADSDDEIILLSPYYFNHEMAICLQGCRPVVVPTDARSQPDLAALRTAITDRTRAIVTVSPNNPSGAVYSADTLQSINALCQSHNLYHISDEAYEYFTYNETAHYSPASAPDARPHTISLYSLSKAYGMAGWRIGYMVVPDELTAAMDKISDTNLVCPPLPSQIAATAALRCGRAWCQQRIDGFAPIRDSVLEHLDTLGAACRTSAPDGAFYVLAQLDYSGTDAQLVQRLISQSGVAVMPGSTFGASGCAIRIAYGALDAGSVAQGMQRLQSGLRKLLGT